MSAGMGNRKRPAGIILIDAGGLERNVSQFLDGKGIEIGTKGNDLFTRLPALQQPNDPGDTHPGTHFMMYWAAYESFPLKRVSKPVSVAELSAWA